MSLSQRDFSLLKFVTMTKEAFPQNLTDRYPHGKNEGNLVATDMV